MKKTYKNNSSYRLILTIALLAFIPMIFSSCSRDNDPVPSQQELVTQKLTASPWVLQSVTVDGFDQTGTYSGMTLSFTSTGFTSVNGRGVWPDTGSWTWRNEEATSFSRNDGVIVSIQDISNTSLRIEMDWDETTFIRARTSSIGGKHVFVFGK
jgi:hypothetical protein